MTTTLLNSETRKETTMHDVYGRPFHTEVTDNTVTYYFSHNNQLVTVVYDRRSTKSTTTFEALPKSLS